MIYQNTETENTQNQFSNAVKQLQCKKLLRKANITKASIVSANIAEMLKSKVNDWIASQLFLFRHCSVTYAGKVEYIIIEII